MKQRDAGDAPSAARGWRGRGYGRWILLGIALIVLFGIVLPRSARTWAFFRVRSVEVRGARLIEQRDIAELLGVDTTQSIWQPLDSLRARLEGHPQIGEVRLRRWLPSTLIVTVTENMPVALSATSTGMKAYDQYGAALPLDLTRNSIDVPIVSRPDTGVLRLLAELKVEVPELFMEISEVRLEGSPGSRGDATRSYLRLTLRGADVLTLRTVGTERFNELSSVERYLASRGIRALEYDLRFQDQVIARVQ